MIIREATPADLPALTDIYNQEVAHGAATFDTQPVSPDSRRRWLETHGGAQHPLLVCEADGQVAGYACLSPFDEKAAYASTVELSVYVGQAFRRRGIAEALTRAVLQRACDCADTHLVVSRITAGNEASLSLHRKLGFTQMGTLPECGRKLGAWQSVETWYLRV